MLRSTLFFLLLLIFRLSFAQYPVLEDEKTMYLVSAGLEKMYNLESDAADSIFKEIIKDLPNHPVGPFLLGLNTYWRYFPILPTMPTEDEIFVNYMKETVELSSKILKKDKYHLEGSFFNLVSHALLMLHYADNGLSGKVFPHANPSYRQILKSFKMKHESDEFYFITGLYNYYVQAYPEAHSVYKPIIMFFRKGDKERGLKQLKYAYRNSIFLNTEALQYLSSIYISFENNVDTAVHYSKVLYELYPGNHYFLSKHIEYLLLAKDYNKAIPLVKKMFTYKEDKYHLMWAILFKGIIEERYYKELDKAEEKYELVLELAELYGERTRHTTAYAHVGLSRICKSSSAKESKAHIKKAKKTATYDYVFW